jgi:transposase InsO family protein
MVWKATSVMEERIKFIVRALNGDFNFSGLCEEFGVSRSTGYRWLNRYRDCGNIIEVKELSRRPHHSPTKTSTEHEERIKALRLAHGWGARKLQVLLAQEGIVLPSITINRILKRQGLVGSETCHRPALRRFERACPNELWQMDFKGDYALRSGRCYPLSILDDHSRFAVGLYALADQKGESVNCCLVDTFGRYGTPEAMLMDHGSPWWSTTNGYGLTWLAVSLIKQGIRLYKSGIRHPQTQGKVERFHRTLKDSIRHVGQVSNCGNPKTISEWEKALERFCKEYNYKRPHEALEMAVPADRYKSSPRSYNPNPAEWDYPQGTIVRRLNTQGSLDYKGGRYFVCEALGKEYVQIERVENSLLVKYRHMYIREIYTETGRSAPLILPVSVN